MGFNVQQNDGTISVSLTGILESNMNGMITNGTSVEIVTSCLNCASSTSLLATVAVLLVGIAFAGHAKRRESQLAAIGL